MNGLTHILEKMQSRNRVVLCSYEQRRCNDDKKRIDQSLQEFGAGQVADAKIDSYCCRQYAVGKTFP